MNDVGKGELEALQERLEAAATVKATTTATRNKKKFMIPDGIREMAAAAQCRGSIGMESTAEESTRSPKTM